MRQETALRKFLRTSGVRQQDFAEAIGVVQGKVSLLASGQQTPDLKLAARIQIVTQGQVSILSWLPADLRDQIDGRAFPQSDEAA